MRAAAVLACLAGAALAAEDDPADRRAFVEYATERTTFYVGESARVTLRIGVDASWFREHAVQRYRRELDLPVHVHASAFAALGGTPVASGRPGVRVALNDGVVVAAARGDRKVADRSYAVLEIGRVVRFERTGELALAAPAVGFSYALHFEDDFVGGRVPVAPRDATVSGAPLELSVLPLPTTGRPPEFGGAVGRYTATATADPLRVAAGGTLRLTLRIAGEGDLGSFEAPRLADLPAFSAFRVVGVLDDRAQRGATVRTITYELAPDGPRTTEIPSVPFTIFDPTPPAAYRVVPTGAIAIVVDPLPGTTAAGGPLLPPRLDDDSAPPSAPKPDDSVPAAAVIAVAAALAVAAVLWRARLRDRSVSPDDARARGAASAFRSALAAGATDPSNAFAEYVAAHLRCPAAAAIAPDLADRLAAAGVQRALAKRAADFLERCVADRYRGPFALPATGDGAPDRRREAAALVDELEPVFTAARRTAI